MTTTSEIDFFNNSTTYNKQSKMQMSDNSSSSFNTTSSIDRSQPQPHPYNHYDAEPRYSSPRHHPTPISPSPTTSSSPTTTTTPAAHRHTIHNTIHNSNSNTLSSDDPSNDDPRFSLPPSPGRRILCPTTGIVYELGEQIGSGAAAVVFKCRKVIPAEGVFPERLDVNEIAAKVMDLRGLRLRTDFQREREKLRREVTILSRLHHPCIVNLSHVIETKDELFLMMELVKGGELFYQIVQRGALTEDQARYILLQILSALEYMHGKGVIHRDLKPENILISSEPYPGFFTIKVADFGLAKLVMHGISEAKTFVGTPQYWAPEVIDSSTSSNHIYGPEADLWSLGCVVYVMLGGSYPFDTRRGPMDTLIKNARYHFGYDRWKTISEDAKNMIRGLLTVDPKKRMTLSDILKHPWITSYRTPPKVPPLPILAPFASKDFENSIQITTRSILGPTPSFYLEGSIPRPVPTATATEQLRGTRAEDDVRGEWEKEDKKALIESAAGAASMIQSKATDQYQQQHKETTKQKQVVGRLAFDERFEDPVSRLARQETRAAFPPQQQFTSNQDRPDDPNTRAIVPVYQSWRPPQPYYQGYGPAPMMTPPYNEMPPPPYWWYPPQIGYPPYQQAPGWSPASIVNPTPGAMPQLPHAQPPPIDQHPHDYWQPDTRHQHPEPTVPERALSQEYEAQQPQQLQQQTPYATFLPMTTSEDESTSSTVQQPQIIHPEESTGTPYQYESPPTNANRHHHVDSPSYDLGDSSAATVDAARAKREETVRTAELIFNFDELLELQIYIMRKFHWAYIALRRCPNTSTLLRKAISEVQDVQDESLQVIRQFETTCSSVLKILPDLTLAVTERQPQLAIDLFEDIRVWVNGLKLMVEKHQTRLTGFIQHVADLVEDIRNIKVSTDQKFLRAAANLTSLCDEVRSESGGESCGPRVHSVDSNLTGGARAQSSGSKASTADVTALGNNDNDEAKTKHPTDPTDDCIKMILAKECSTEDEGGHHDYNQTNSGGSSSNGNGCGSNTGFQEWYDDVKDTVLGQIESLVGKAVEEIRPKGAEAEACCGTTEISRIANDLLDLLFISPGSWAEHQRALAKRKCIKSGCSTLDNTRRHSNSHFRRRLSANSFVAKSVSSTTAGGEKFPNRSRSHSNPDSTQTGSDDSDFADSSSLPSQHHHHSQPQGRVSTTAPATDGEFEHPNEPIRRRNHHRSHWRQKEERQRRWRCRQQMYCQALKTSEILVRALDEVRRVDQILRQSSQFWINLTLIIDQLCKMKTHTERLLQYSCSSREFANRFFERLNDYRDFWTALRDQSHRYVVDAASKMRALNEFALALESTADRADTANALHLGQSAAIMG